MYRFGLVCLVAALSLDGCTHHQARCLALVETFAVESSATPEKGGVDSGSDAESTAAQTADSTDGSFPTACTSICEPDFWECRCAFALKSGIKPECTNEFAVDHGTKCEVETIHECLGVVLNRATARYDQKLAEATGAALDCLRSAVIE